MRFLFYLFIIISIILLWQSRLYAMPVGCDNTAIKGSTFYGNTRLCGLYASVSGGYTFSADKLNVGDDRNNPNYGITHTTTNLSPMATSALGYDFYRNFHLPIRAELAYGFQGKYTQNSHIQEYDSITGELIDINRDYQYQNQTLLYNTYYDLHSAYLGHVVPYVGFGVGFAQNRGRSTTNATTLSEHHGAIAGQQDWAPAWNAALGTDYMLSDHWAVGTQWRLANLGWRDLVGATHANRRDNWIEHHTITSDIALLVRYEF